MRYSFLAIILCAIVGCTANKAQDAIGDQAKSESENALTVVDSETVDSASVDSADEDGAGKQLSELKSNFEKSFASFEKMLSEAANDSEMKAIFEEKNPVPTLIAGLTRIANDYGKTKAGFEAALEVVSRSKGAEKDGAMNLLISKYASRLEYKKVIQSMLEDLPSSSIENWLKLLIEYAPNKESEVRAKLGFARYVNQIPAFRDGFVKNPHVLAKLPKPHQEYLTRDRTENENLEVAEFLNAVISEAPEGHYRRGRSFAEFAKSALFELENLGVGCVAPDIVGNDLDGIEFKLSDYKGKVVMLDFWGHWCGPCRRMYSHERDMVEALASKPFALIGMNSDGDLEFAKEAVESEGLAWRHYWNGPKGTMGPISAQWNVEAWPTVYLIDGNGIIRYKNVLGEDLDRAIETLLGEMGHEVSLQP